MGKARTHDSAHLKRLACQVYTQLPEDSEEAVRVLDLVREIIFDLGAAPITAERTTPILPFSPGLKGLVEFPKAAMANQNDRPDRANPE